jgi:hypothetical protein
MLWYYISSPGDPHTPLKKATASGNADPFVVYLLLVVQLQDLAWGPYDEALVVAGHEQSSFVHSCNQNKFVKCRALVGEPCRADPTNYSG